VLFLKLDIVKAFDSISWAYLLEVLQRLGFGAKWRGWISLALSTSSSRVLLNGAPGKPLKHERGLRQGDPISPMLFILAMDLLQRILLKATEKGILQPIGPQERGIKISLYADDAAIFVKPSHSDIVILQSLLDVFGQASVLRTNINKSEVYPIACSGLDLTQILEGFPAAVKTFPCRYLGLPLHPKKLRKIDFLPLLDKVGAKLPSW
jgi:hypothetical protein